jgi:alpha-beta hydrolase superfamily lysophospholipase
MDEQESWYLGAGDARLYCRTCRTSSAPRAAVISLHGLGDHSGLYPMLGEALVPHGMAVVSPDLRGNGRSPGQRGYVAAWTDLREDLRRLVARTQSELPGVPLFLLGNSLGGLVVLDFAGHHPAGVRGVVALAPPLGALGVPPALLVLGRVLSRVWPRFSLRTGMDLSGLSRDPAVLAEVRADPLFHRRGTARLSTEVTATIARVQRDAAAFPLPLLVIHGTDDRMVPPDGSRRFVERVGQRDKTLFEVPGAYHALLADLDRERVLAEIRDWVAARI